MKLTKICQSVTDQVVGALACGLVDLNRGMVVREAHKGSGFTETWLDAVAAAAVEMFRGKSVATVEKLLSAQRGEAVSHTFREIQVRTEETWHLMSILPDRPDYALVLVTTHKANVARGWIALREVMGPMAELCALK